MSSSIDENYDSKKKDVDVRLAESDAAVDLKVEADKFGVQLVVAAPEVKAAAAKIEPTKSSITAKPTPASQPPMPRIFTGILTIGCIWFCLLMANASWEASHFSSWAGSIPWAFAALGASAVHLAWSANAFKMLRARTGRILSECQSAPRQNLLLTLLPASWIGLVGICFWQRLPNTTSPCLEIVPWLVFASIIYWLASLSRWPYKLSSIGKAERLATIRNGKLPLDPRVFALLREAGRYLIPILLLPLSFWGLTLPYVWYWKQEVNDAENLQRKKVDARHSAADPNRLVIRYRTFAATERWLRHRLTSNSGHRLKNGAIALASLVVFGTVLLAFVNLVVLKNMDWFSQLIGNLIDANKAGAIGSNGAYAVYNAMVLRSFGSLALMTLLFASIVYIRQRTHYEFTAEGFRSFRWRNGRKAADALVAWSRVKQVRLNRRSKKTQVNDLEIEFNLTDGKPVRLKLGSIESVEDRQTILQAIERWAPHVSRDAELVQALQPPVDHSYTELWLQALSAPPRRDRLNPLVENTELGAGRYRIRRALGVGGQGAAYEAFDGNAGELVVLKEFLLPIYVDISVRKEVLERFEGEARILKNLDHPQVVKLADYFVEDHRAYLVLEHIDGLSLRETVAKQGPLPVARVKELAQQMCCILTYLHEQEPPVVHRDFTPENLILRHDGTLKLIDFNVARQVESTVTSSVVGKPAYLPPEQFRGTPVPQSDIYGMGATLAFLLTGKDPEPINVSHPRETVASVSDNMDQLVAHATAIEVRDRYQTCQQILKDLDYAMPEPNNDRLAPPVHHSTAAESAAASQATPHNDAQFEYASHEDNDDTVTLKEQQGAAELIPTAGNGAESAAAVGANENPSSHQGNLKQSTNLFNLLSKSAALVAWLSVAVIALWAVAPESVFFMDGNAKLHKLERAAAVAQSNGDKKLALKLYDECLSIDPSDAVAHAGKGGILFPGVFPGTASQSATDEFAKAAALDPDNKYYDGFYAECLFSRGQWAEAARMFQQTLDAKRFSMPQLRNGVWVSIFNPIIELSVRKQLIDCYLHTGDYKKAQAILPGSGEYWYIYDRIITQELAHEPNQALDTIAQMQREQDYMRHVMTAPQQSLRPIRLHSDALTRAIAALKTNGSEQTKTAYDSFFDGLAQSAVLDWEKSVQSLSKAIEIEPGVSDFYAFRADGLWHLHKNAAALKDADKALSIQPGNLQARYLRARILMQMHQYASALPDFDAVLKVVPSDHILIEKGRCLADMGQLEEANQLYERAAASSYRRQTVTRMMRALDLHKAGRDKEALAAINRLFAERSDFWYQDEYPFYLRGQIYLSLGQAKLAEKDLARYEELGQSREHPIIPRSLTDGPRERDAFFDSFSLFSELD